MGKLIVNDLAKPNGVFVYHIGSIVYLRICPDRRKGMVTGIMLRPDMHLYLVTWADETCERGHYEMELTTEYLPDYESCE